MNSLLSIQCLNKNSVYIKNKKYKVCKRQIKKIFVFDTSIIPKINLCGIMSFGSFTAGLSPVSFLMRCISQYFWCRYFHPLHPLFFHFCLFLWKPLICILLEIVYLTTFVEKQIFVPQFCKITRSAVTSCTNVNFSIYSQRNFRAIVTNFYSYKILQVAL